MRCLLVCVLAAGLACGCEASGDDRPDSTTSRVRTVETIVTRTTESAATAADSPVAALVDQMSIEQLAGQLVMTKVMGTKLSVADRAGIERANLGGVILFGFNYTDQQQMRAMVAQMQQVGRAASGHDIGMFVSVDQEGGPNRHFMDMQPFDSAAQIGSSASAEDARAIGERTAADLKTAGVNMDLAPVADLASPPTRMMAGRSFGSDPDRVAELVGATVEGLEAGGVAAVAKHFPGLGAAPVNTDKGVSYVERTREQIDTAELVPFRAAIDADVDAIMVSHGVYPSLGATTPATVSPQVIDGLLRDELEYDGVVVTDSMNARGFRLEYAQTVPIACVDTVRAGVDLVLLTGSMETALLCRRRLRDAVESGELSRDRFDEAVRRVLELKQRLGLLPEGP